VRFSSLEFFLFSITGSGAYQAYYSVGTWIPFWHVKAAGV